MRLHWIQHVPFEGLGYIETWAKKRNFIITESMMHEDHELPETGEIDLLVVMGGPMGVHDTSVFPWLLLEKRFIDKAINEGVKTVGICLGAQLIADVMGAAVKKNPEKEIGWFGITPEKEYGGLFSGIFNHSPEVFHWHGDTFAIPEGCSLICSSDACINQAFEYEGRVLGLQFHLETTRESALSLIENCRDELLAGGNYVQNEQNIMSDLSRFEKINFVLEDVLDRLVSGNK